jgi:hypothetical protein
MTYKKVNKGGITYGKSHAEGGIPVHNASTGQMLEVEGGEGIINKKAMASQKTVKIDGKEMTICEAASYLNEKDGNGRQFNCDDVEHQQFITDHYGIGGELQKGIKTEKEHSKTLEKLYNQQINPKQAVKEVAKEHIKENPKYYTDLEKMKMAKGGVFMNDQDAENAIFDETVFANGGTTTAYDAALHKKMYMLGIEVMQPNPIALAKAMSNENDNFCEHYPKLCSGAEYQREELPQIYDKNYDEFVAYLENLGATVNFETAVQVDTLKPVQNEISLERMARIMARVKEGYYKDLNLLKLPLFVSKDGYILDGHHRWATLFFLSPLNTLDIYRVNLTYKELVNKALNFDDAGTEKFMLGGKVNHQNQLDNAYKYQSINDKRRTSYLDIQYRDDYQDLYRMEGSSQSMMKTKIASGITAQYGYKDLGSLVVKLFNSYVIPAAKEVYRIDKLALNFSYDWSIELGYIESKDKRSYAYDWFFNEPHTSTGIFDIFRSNTAGYNKRIVQDIYKNAFMVFVERVIQSVQESSFDSFIKFDDFVGSLDIPIKVFAENIKNIFIYASEFHTNSPITDFEWFTETDYKRLNQAALLNGATPITNNMQGTYSYFDVAYGNASGEIRYDFTDPPKDCRVEIACNIDSQITALDDMDYNLIGSKREELFTDFLVEELNATAAKLERKNQNLQLVFEGTSSDPYTVVQVKLNDTNWIIAGLIISDLPISNYLIYKISSAVANFAAPLLQMLDNTGWRGKGVSDFANDSRYKQAKIELEKDLQVVFDVSLYFIDEKNRNSKLAFKDLNFSKWLDNFKQFPKTPRPATTPSSTNTGWTWRFKTEQEFIDEYGTDWEDVLPNEAAWGRDMDEYNMDFLFGQPIIQNEDTEYLIKDFSGNKEEQIINVQEYFGIKNPNQKGSEVFTIWKEFLTDKPLPNAVNAPAVASQKGSLYYALESEYKAKYSITRMNIENRFSYMDWEEIVTLYKKAKQAGLSADRYFAYAVCVAYNTSRMTHLLNSAEVLDMLEKNLPSNAMRELFSSNYYFSPVYFEFYENLITALNEGYVPANIIKTGSIQLDSIIRVGQSVVDLSSANKSNFGCAGLGDYRENGAGDITYPNIITTEFLGNARKAYESSTDLADKKLKPFLETLSYENEAWVNTELKQSAVPIIATLSNSIDEYQNIREVDTRAIYTTNRKSNLNDYQKIKGGLDYTNDFMFWDLARPLLPQNFYILADYNTLLQNFEVDGYITDLERKFLNKVGVELQLRSDSANGNFLVDIQKIPYDMWNGVISRMEGYDNLPATDRLALNKFMEIYNKVVVTKANEKIYTLFEETTTGVMHRSGVGFMPNATTSTPTTIQQSNGIREVYYNELMYNSPALKPTEKIVGARFLTKQEILDYNAQYGTSEIGMPVVTTVQDAIGKTAVELQDALTDIPEYELITKLQGKKINENLLPAIDAIFKFQKQLPQKDAKKVFRTTWDEEPCSEEIQSRLNFGRAAFDEYEFWKPLFPNVSEQEYEKFTKYGEIDNSPNFPEWYKKVLYALFQARETAEPTLDKYNFSTGFDVYAYEFFTGEIDTDYKDFRYPYITIPVSYLVLQIEDQSVSSTQQPKASKIATKKAIKSVPLIDFLYTGVLQKDEKIVSARFLTKQEIESLGKYELSYAGFNATLKNATAYATNWSLNGIYESTKRDWTEAVFGEQLNPQLLPAVIEVYKFYKAKNFGLEKIKRTPYQESVDNRLSFGRGVFQDWSDYASLFPNVLDDDYNSVARGYQQIKQAKFPAWYIEMIDQVIIAEYLYNGQSKTIREIQEEFIINQDFSNPYEFYTGIDNVGYRLNSLPYGVLPFAYLMIDIETNEPVSSTTNIKKLKDEYAAIQYYLNVEVPVDSFAQRKLITSVMNDISNKLEKEIEALYYSPSFEPLFELWADKQTQGQRTINLQPCMLPTPNGQKSELDLVQYEIVRTEEFKKWFGDWEEAAKTGNYNGVSKAINPLTKEPQVSFHGKANMALEFTKMGFVSFPIKYFGTNLSYAEWFRDNQSTNDNLTKVVYEFFLDIKNPIDLSPIGLTLITAEEFKEVIRAMYNYEIQSPIITEGTGRALKLWQIVRNSVDMLQELKANTYFDGIIMYEDNPQDSATGYDSGLLGFSPNSYDIVQNVQGDINGNFTLDYVTFSNFQIKAADGRNRTFFNNVEDFRFGKGGITKTVKK